MMDCTDRHDRAFLRCLTRRTLLYTEMVVADAVLHGDRERLLGFDPVERPVALQLAGAEPERLAEAARIAEGRGFDEVNLNVGCPSARVRSGRFGACLMAEPATVARCVGAMIGAVSIPVTVKCRIGIDAMDEERALEDFMAPVAEAGCASFAVHARKAWLRGLSPRRNRELPPLRYDVVYAAKRRFAGLEIVLNGGVLDLDSACAHLRRVDGVMIGRAAYRTPYVLAEADRVVFGDTGAVPTRREAVARYLPHVASRLAEGVPLHRMTRHMLGLFQGRPGARLWRRVLSTRATEPGAGIGVIEQALARLPADGDAVA